VLNTPIGQRDHSLESTRPLPLCYEPLKRVLDVIGAVTGLVILSPLLLVLAVLTKLSDGGPVLYQRTVVAQNGGTFSALKFRTMIASAESPRELTPDLRRQYEQTLKLHNDPRVTPLGRKLRKSSLDELPQLVNVLRGQMSLVGPRIIHPSELERFGDFGPLRCSVRPGITGLWQISGRSELTYDDRIELDKRYVRSRSMSMDLRILLKTVAVVFTGRGAV
jgi:exopolysaccharide production protein ExoY